jgi:hypothetical protein
MYLDQTQEADFHLELVQSVEQLRDQGDKEIVVEGELAASKPDVAAASTSDSAFSVDFNRKLDSPKTIGEDISGLRVCREREFGERASNKKEKKIKKKEKKEREKKTEEK